MPLFFEPPYSSDFELDYGCTYIATYILKKTWGKLRDKRRPWKITRNSIVHDMAEDGKEMALRAIRMGYYWHLSCSEKDHLHYITRALQCNKKLYSFLWIFRKFLTLQAFNEKELRKLVEISFRVDSTTYRLVDVQGREVLRRNTCTYDTEIEALRGLKMSKQVLKQKVEELRASVHMLSESELVNFGNISKWLVGERLAWDESYSELYYVGFHRTRYYNMKDLVLANSQLSKCISWLHALETKGQTPQANESNTLAAPNGDVKEEMDQVSTRVTETNGVERKVLRKRSILYGRMVTRFFMAFGRRKHPMAKALGREALYDVAELGALCYAASVETTYPNFRHNFDTCKQTLYGLFYWMKLLTNAEVFKNEKKRGELCRAGLGLYDMMLDVARNGGFVPEQGAAKKQGAAAETEPASVFGSKAMEPETILGCCKYVMIEVQKVCKNWSCAADSIEKALVQRAIDCGDCVSIYSKKIGQYDFFDMVTYCEKQARMCEYYLLLAEEFLPHHKDRFVFIRQEIRALAELLSRFSVHNNIEQTQKYNLPFPEPVKRRKSPNRPRRKDKETKKGGSDPSPAPSGK